METRLHTQIKTVSPRSFTPMLGGGVLPRKCACSSTSGGLSGECAGCNEKKLSLQRSTQNSELESRNSAGVPPIVHEVLRSPGQPLDQETREFFQPRFGHDVSSVRVHADGRAAEAASAVNALAYTIGSEIAFGAGQYAPSTAAGRRLLAHELTHVVQQAGANLGVSVMPGQSDDRYEQEAARVANDMSKGGRPSISESSSLRLSRQDEPERVWGGFRITGDAAYVNAIRAELDRLNGTSEGAAILSEISAYTAPWYRSYIRISPSSACGFLPSGISFSASGCSVPNNCSGATSEWTSVPSMVYLHHEIVHAYIYHIMDRGTDPDRECMTTGLGHYFGSMPHSENKLRCELGLPVRPCYDGECRLAAPTCNQPTGSVEPPADIGARHATMNRPFSPHTSE